MSSRELELSRIITEKIDRMEMEDNLKNFLIEVLRFEKSIANREKVPYLVDYKVLIEKFIPRSDT